MDKKKLATVVGVAGSVGATSLGISGETQTLAIPLLGMVANALIDTSGYGVIKGLIEGLAFAVGRGRNEQGY